MLWCEFSSLNCVSFAKGIFKFTAGRKLPTGFRRLKQRSKATAESVEGVGELDGQVNVIKSNVRSKKNIQEGYARADSLDKQQLKKYVKDWRGRPCYSGMPGWSDFSLDVSISISIDEAKKG